MILALFKAILLTLPVVAMFILLAKMITGILDIGNDPPKSLPTPTKKDQA